MGQFTLAPTCSTCLASTYSEFGPDRDNSEFNEWLSKVRLIINKNESENIGDNIRNGLNHLPVDVQDFQWSQDVILTPQSTATSYFEYEIDRINLRWSEPGPEKAEPHTLRQQEWDLADGMENFKFIHESCFTLLIDMLKDYNMRNGIEGRCSAKSLWQCLCDIGLVEDDSVPNSADLSWQAFLFRPEERDLWKFTNPLPLDQERQDATAHALEQIRQLQPQYQTSSALGTDLESSQKRSVTVVGLKPGDDCAVTGFRYSMSPDGKISQILLLEANLDKALIPRTQYNLNSLYRSSKPVIRTSWPTNMPPGLTIEKGIGMDSQRYRLDRTEVINITPSDPMVKIHISATKASMKFTTASGDTQRLLCTLGSSGFPAPQPFEMDGMTEKIVSIQLTYVNYYGTAFPELDPWKFHDRVTEPELVDVVFTTNLGRSSGEIYPFYKMLR
ncbi:hypothetical protein IFR05_014238 [Cadophora sp. M221]|nr:hypothetical protein IFR05_014238 [Cadophora sp. M221]